MFKKFSIYILVLILLIIPTLTFAQTGNTEIPIDIPNPFNGGDDLMTLITTILNRIVMPIAAVGVVVWIIWAGFGFIMAQGKEAEITKAKSRLLWSLIGAGILLGAAAISAVVETTIRAIMTP